MSTPIEKMIDQVCVMYDIPAKETDKPYAIAEGILTIAGNDLHVFILNDGRRIIAKEDLDKFFGADFLEEMVKIMDKE